MVRILDDVVNVVGDSLDACLYSRYLATKPEIKKINHYTTGEYGGFYFDEHKDSSYVALFFTKTQLQKIESFVGALNSVALSENYVKVPVKKIKFASPFDEYVSFPICRDSFEISMDYQDNILRECSLDEFMSEYKECKNITKIMKTIFDDSFYMNVVKKIGCNQWNLNQSQLDPARLYNSLHLEQLGSNKPFEYFYATNGISDICRKLLADPKIEIHTKNRRDIKKEIKVNSGIVSCLFEYVDYYMDFMFGGFDYMQASTDIHSKSISDNRYFRVNTPFDKEYYSYFGVDSITYKTKNINSRIRSHEFKRQILIPSQLNHRKMVDYKKVAIVSRNIKIFT